MSEAIWFYEDDGERKGPVTADFLTGLLKDGALREETLVWRDGFADWIPFRDTELFESAATDESAPPTLLPTLRKAGSFVPRAISFNFDYEFSIKKLLGQGWRLMVSDFWPFVGFFTIMYLILGLVSQLGLTMLFLMYPLMAGYSWYALLRKRGQPAEMDLLFEGFRRQFGPLALANLVVMGIAMLIFIVVGIACVGGCVGVVSVVDGAGFDSGDDPLAIALMIIAITLLSLIALIPMVLVNQVGSFVILLILDGNLTAGESMSLAWKATKRRWFKLVLLGLVAFVLMAAGLVALYVGIFVACAWVTLAQVYLYEEAFGESED